ncbi:NAD-dependent epimerase/dehydratase [Trametes punicea]|nr:NAD-dependent epimerase/dehydratase [Trametes punicea]
MLDRNDLILVTGAHGFLGGHVARKLHDLGYRIRVTDVIPYPPHGAQAVGEIIIGNLCDPSFCFRVVDGVDYVLHFAATMGGMGTIHAANDFIIYQENHRMTLNLLSACTEAGVREFVYASSACVYPESLQAPGTDISLAESDVWKNPPPHPQGLYGLEKLVSELVQLQLQSRMEIKIARFHNVYGPLGSWYGGREKVPAAFLRKAIAAQLSGDAPIKFEIWGDGEQRRSFCFIEDAVEAVLRLLESDCHEPVNVGSDQAISVRQLADCALAVAEVDTTNVVFEYRTDRPIGVGSRNSDNTFVRAQLSWEPSRSLEDGMRLTGEWIRSQILQAISPMNDNERREYLQLLQTSDLVNLQSDAVTFAILLPITSRGSNSPGDCLTNLERFAHSLAQTTADDVSRLGERYAVRIYLAIDDDDDFLWQPDGRDIATPILQAQGFRSIVTLRCDRPRGHVCALWRDCARKAYHDHCDYYILMGDDVLIQDANWMSSIHKAFAELSKAEHLPHGIGCVAFTDTSFPGMPTFPAIHRIHMDVFGGEVIPDCFTNQDGDPFLFQLYRRWGCARMIPSRIRNEVGGSEAARAVEAWLRRHAPGIERKLTLDVVVPCYRVNLHYLDAVLALRHSPTCEVIFVIIIDDPQSPRIGELMRKYGHRPDVRIRVNNQNLGASASRNRGLQESAGEWVHFLDDDVTPDEDLLIQAIRGHPKAAGFVGNALFPSADSIFTAAVHLAGVTFFWNIADHIEEDVPWGVTANLIARRNVPDGVAFNLQFPKTGGGEDIDYCRKKRVYSLAHGGEGLWGAPAVRVTHPWWHGGERSYWRFYMWSKGDGGLIKLYPEHSYRDMSPNAAECLLLSGVVLTFGAGLAFFWHELGARFMCAGITFASSTIIANIVFDLYRHLFLHPERVRGVKTTVKGAQWICAIIEGALLRVFSEWGRVVGMLERGECHLLMKRFDWFCGRWGERPQREEMANKLRRLTLTITFFATLVVVTSRYSSSCVSTIL